jgi:hypothetical protein
MKKFVFCISLFFAFSAFGQTNLNGRVRDPNGEALAFVSVLVDDAPGGKVLLTDIEGRFSLLRNTPVRSLTFRYVGYETLRVEASDFPKKSGETLEVVLQPKDYAIGEVVVRAGENPADILMRKAIARRKANNPELLEKYRCKTYNKVVFDLVPHRAAFDKEMAKADTSKEKNRKRIEGYAKFERQVERQHAFLMESVTERTFRFPNQVQEEVLLNRVSGFENAGLVSIANAVQPFSFYGDHIRILDKEFVNPVSPGSPDRYFFNIEDTLTDGRDTIWVISFKPRKGKVFVALQGVLHLHSDGWAIQSVRARPAFFNPNMSLKVEQAYQRDSSGRQWFPEQLNFEIEMLQYPGPEMGMKAAGRSFIRDIDLDPKIRQRNFDPEMPLILTPNANRKDSSSWALWRDVAPLDKKEWRTYTFMDSIGKAQNLDRVLAVFDYLATGRFPIYKGISLDLGRFLRFNEYENVRFGLGLTTATSRSLRRPKRLEANAYLGYGIRDKGWKYGGSALWRIHRGFRTQFRVGWQNDLREPGTLYELDQSGLFNRALYAERMDAAREWSASLSSRLWRGATAQVTLRDQLLSPLYGYRFGETGFEGVTRFHYQEATAYLRYVWREELRTLFGANQARAQRFPALELAYTEGRLLGGTRDVPYQRVVAALSQNVMVRRLGRLQWRLEAGQVFGNVPASKLFTLNQTGGRASLFAVANTFQALPDTLFLTNRFANLYFSQELGPILYQHKRSAPQLTLLQNITWGDLRRGDLQREVGFLVAQTPVYESGVRLDNLLRFNYVNFYHIGVGVATFYRWGYLQSKRWEKNIRPRLALKLEF